MVKINKYIEVVGSRNPRPNAATEISQQTIVRVLRKHYSRVGMTVVKTVADLDKLVAKRPDLVVLGTKLVLLEPSMGYDSSPKLWLSSYLNEHGINFTGSDTNALISQFDKPAAKQQVRAAGLRTAAYFISRVEEPTFRHNLTYPLFVKLPNRGDSKGIDERSLVYSQAELESKIAFIHSEYSSDALIEEYLPGREFSVAIMKQSLDGSLLAMPIEITTAPDTYGNSFLSEAVKKADSEKVIAVTDPKLREAVSNLAIGVFKALGSRDYGRVDMRLDSLGAPNFIEANLMPGLSTHGYLARCCYMNEGISYEDMILSIVDLALARSIDLLGMLPVAINAHPKETTRSLSNKIGSV